MKRSRIRDMALLSLYIAGTILALSVESGSSDEGVLLLPKAKRKGTVSVEEAIQSRRTRRNFLDRPLDLETLSQLLWAAQGITGKEGYLRAAPSAGGLYPLDVYAVVGSGGVEGLKPGVYHYLPPNHELEAITPGDLRKEMSQACLGQGWMARAPVSFVITAEYSRIESKYGPRAERYSSMEVGHAGQNIFLQAEALGLGAGIVGAFDDDRLAKVLHLHRTHHPLIVMPVGYAK
jgi:SagB-type dehydrogenase family enzyme